MTANRPSLDRLFRVLSNHRRRYVLYYLEDAENAIVTVTDLTNYVVQREREWKQNDDQPETDHRDEIRIDLHHNHLPRISDMGLIDYDARSKTIRDWEEPSIDCWTQANRAELDQLELLFSTAES